MHCMIITRLDEARWKSEWENFDFQVQKSEHKFQTMTNLKSRPVACDFSEQKSRQRADEFMATWNLNAKLASAQFLHSRNFLFKLHKNCLWTYCRTCLSATNNASDNLAKAHQGYRSDSNVIKVSESVRIKKLTSHPTKILVKGDCESSDLSCVLRLVARLVTVTVPSRL